MFLTKLKIGALLVLGVTLACFAGAAPAAEKPKEEAKPKQEGNAQPGKPQKAATLDALQKEVDDLKAHKVAWREIAWKSCLLEGLAESRAKNKPVLLWVFIDRPIDDARC